MFTNNKHCWAEAFSGSPIYLPKQKLAITNLIKQLTQKRVTVLITRDIFFRNGISGQRQKKKHYDKILYIRISLITKFQLKQEVLIFCNKFTQKGYFRFQTEKNNYHQWIQYIWISLVTNFHLKQQFSIFGPNLPKRIFHSITGKLNITIEFIIFELIQVHDFILKRQFWFSRTNLLKRGISVLTQKRNMNIQFSMFKLAQVPNFILNRQFWFLGPNFFKKGCKILLA